MGRFWDPQNKIPCNKPPFGELVAVNVNTGDIAWHVPLGFVEELKAKGIDGTGALNMGGPIVTASGLIFVGASNDKRFRAFDTKTGKMLWETALEASAHSVPMTFMGTDSRQYVVVAAGGGSFINSSPGTKIVAFALPAPGASRQTAGASAAPAPRVAASATRPADGAAAGTLPAGAGRELVQRYCTSSCHDASTAVGTRRTQADWTRVTADMLARASAGTPTDAAQITEYLSRNFGRADVNAAPAGELALVLGLTAAEASAIVEVRTHDGAFRGVDDLRNVPGLDFAKVQRVRDRIVIGR